MIYHIAGRAAWAEAQTRGHYSAPSLDNEGFIHCSTRDQLLQVANDFYRGETEMLVLCIEESKLGQELRWEAPAHPKPLNARETAEDSLFPHLYGVLNLDAVSAVYELNEGASGFALPTGLT